MAKTTIKGSTTIQASFHIPFSTTNLFSSSFPPLSLLSLHTQSLFYLHTHFTQMAVISRLLATGLALSTLLGSTLATAGGSVDETPEQLQVLETRGMQELEPRANHSNKHPHSHKKKSTGKHHHQPKSEHHAVESVHAPAVKRGNCKAGLGWVDNSVNQKPFQQGACWYVFSLLVIGAAVCGGLCTPGAHGEAQAQPSSLCVTQK